ncbi:MAG TPA: MFS transporter [Terriglobales bacterium]|jgi:ACS family glucarate transporter-like MFS transporter
MLENGPDRRGSRVRWYLVVCLFALGAVSFLDRVNISVAGADLALEYHLSQVQLGSIFSAFLIGYALFQTPGGWLADKLGPRYVLTIGVAWWGIFTALTASLSSNVAGALSWLVLIRLVLGAGEAIIYPASNRFVSQWIPSHERGLANGLIFAGVGAGTAAAPIFVTYLMLHYGWRSSFWASALLGLIVGAVWYVAARDLPEQHPLVSQAELSYIQQSRVTKPVADLPSGPGAEDSAIRAPFHKNWGALVLNRSVLAITASYFCFGYVAWIFFSWFYIYLAKVRGLDLKTSAVYSTLPPVAIVVCSFCGGAISDAVTKSFGKRAGRCGLASVALFLATIFLVLGSRVASATLASIVLSGGVGALYLAQSSYWSVTADIGGKRAGLVSGFMNMGAQFGGALTAWLTPVIAQHYGWTSSFLAAAGLSAVGSVAWLLVEPDHPLAGFVTQSAEQ